MAAATLTPLVPRRWWAGMGTGLLALGLGMCLSLAPAAPAHAAPAKKATTKAASSGKKSTAAATAKTPKTPKARSGGRKATAAAAASATTAAVHARAGSADVLMPLPAAFHGTLALACADCTAGMAYELRLQGTDGDATRGTYELHRQAVNSVAQTPLESGPWRMSYDFGRLILGGGTMPALYAIRDRNTLVQLGIEGKPLEGGQYQLQRVQTSNVPAGAQVPSAAAWTAPAGSSSSSALEATFWKLVRVGRGPALRNGVAQPDDLQRLPHFVLQPGEQRITGSGGCNRFAGSFQREAADNKVLLTGIVSTRVGCAENDKTLLEVAFFDALHQTRRYRLTDNTHLDLMAETGEVLAQFEAVAAPAK